MGIKRWSIGVLLLGACDVFLFTGPRHQIEQLVQSAESRLAQMRDGSSAVHLGIGTEGKTPAAATAKSSATNQNPQASSQSDSTTKNNQTRGTSGNKSPQVNAGPSGVTQGLHHGGSAAVKWYHHDESTIQMDSVWYDHGNQFPLKGTYGHFTGDLVVLVGQFDSSRTTVIHWWTYSIPVKDGNINSTITLPYHGFLEVSVAPVKITSSGEFTTSNNFTFTNVTNDKPTLSNLQMGLLQSWLINYNEIPSIHDLAQKVTAPVKLSDAHVSSVRLRDDEMRAVSNWVSKHIAYNWPAYNKNDTPWQQAGKTLKVRVGVCNDESALAAAMLRSIGVPSRVITGTGSTDGVSGPHQWNESWNGKKWVLFDPTWDQVYYDSQTHRIGLPSKIDNHYFNLSPSVFNKTHLHGQVADW